MPIKVTDKVSDIRLFILILIILMPFSCSKKEESVRSESAPLTQKTQETQTAESHQSVESERAIIQEKQGSPSAETKNLPPQLRKVRLMPEVFKQGDILYVDTEANDPDGDEVTISYEWYKNGELVSTERQLNYPVKRGDTIVIKIKPFDGKDYGKGITLNREILNLPPVIVDHKGYHLNKDTFIYQVKASDPDGDHLSYSLKTAPPGMTIDQNGLIKWNILPDFKGKASVTVSVKDGHGGEAVYNFEVTVETIR